MYPALKTPVFSPENQQVPMIRTSQCKEVRKENVTVSPVDKEAKTLI